MSEIFTWWLFADVEEFRQMYLEFYQSPSTAPLGMSILVYCALMWLMDGNPLLEKSGIDLQCYAKYVPVCERHLQICISACSLFLEPTELNIAALSAAVSLAPASLLYDY